MSADPLAEWHQVLDMYEVEDAEYLTDLHTWYPELIRELLRCRGIEQLRPVTSLMRLHLYLGTVLSPFGCCWTAPPANTSCNGTGRSAGRNLAGVRT